MRIKITPTMKKNVIKVILNLFLAVLLFILLGFGIVKNLLFQKYFLSLNNLVGIAFVIYYCYRIIESKKNSFSKPYTEKEEKKLNKTLKIFSISASIISLSALVCSLFDCDLYSWLWNQILNGSIFILKIIGCIIAVLIGIVLLIGVIVFLFFILPDFISERKEASKPKKEVPKGKEEDNKKEKNIIKNTSTNKSYKNTNMNYCYSGIEYERKISNNICPRCGGNLKKRTNHKNGKTFIGCSNYYKNGCRFTIDK